MKRFHFYAIALTVLLGTMTSCIGVNADITINPDNSGTLTLEYRISGLLDSLGRLDGNQAYPPLPVGKTDMERTVARIPGMKLLSHNTVNSGNDKLITAKLQFSNPDALIFFFDASGEKAAYSRDNNSQKLSFTFSSGDEGYRNRSQDLNALIRQISAGYKVTVTLNLPSNGQLELVDNDGRPVNAGETTLSGRRVSCSMPVENILFAGNGIKARFIW